MYTFKQKTNFFLLPYLLMAVLLLNHMSYLSDLIKKIRQSAGNAVSYIGDKAGIPETNFSELIAGGPTKDYNKARAFDYSNPITTNTGGTPSANTLISNTNYIPTFGVSGAYPQNNTNVDTGGNNVNLGVGNNNPPTGDPNSGEYQDWARIEEEKKRARMDAIMSRLELMKSEANRLRDSAKTQYDFAGNAITENYDPLKALATTKRGSSLSALGQEDTDVQNIYGRLGGVIRKAVQSGELSNRMLARATGSLGSGTYEDSQVNTRNIGLTNLADSVQEEADKRAGIKGRTSETIGEWDVTDQEIAGEEAKLKQDALTEYNNAIASADMMQKGYGIDSEESLQLAETNFGSALNRIRDYIQNKSLKMSEIAATNRTSRTSDINSYQAITPGLQNTLNTNTAQDNANKAIENMASTSGASGGSAGSNYTGSSNSNSYLQKIAIAKQKEMDERNGIFNRDYSNKSWA